MKKVIISFVVGLIIGGTTIGFCAYIYISVQPEKIVIKEIEKPVVKYIKVVDPTDTSALYDCYKSPITIDRKLTGNIYRITASDGCKQTTVADRINVGTYGNYKFYIGIGITGAVIGGYAVYKIVH